MTRALDELAGRETGELPGLGFKRVKLPPGLAPETAIARLAASPDVASAQLNPFLRALGLPNDPLYGPTAPHGQWHLDKIHATEAWLAGVPGHQGSAAVVIAIVDSGLNNGHEDLAPKVVAGYNAINPALPTTDEPCGHGTWVGGVAGAATDNAKGVAGVAWLARLMPVKAMSFDAASGECGGYAFDIDQGILWAASHGARVINLSLGGEDRTDAEAATMQSAWQSGCILVAAAGNEASSDPSYPAAYPFVLGVSATDQNDLLAGFSNRGSYVDVAAPGVAIITTDAFGAALYTSMTGPVNGTSFSAPIVSGLAAVLLGQDPRRTPDDIVRILEQTADHLGNGGPGERNDLFGYGRVNMYRALTGQATPPPPLAETGYAYPNPFSPTLDRYITFVIKSPGGHAVGVDIFDAAGNPVWRRSMSAQETAGADLYYNSPMRWDGRDTRGRDMANGVYKAVITVGPSRTIKHIVVAR